MVAIGFLHLPRWITLQIQCTFTLTWSAISNSIYSIHLYMADVSFKSWTFSQTNTQNSIFPPDTGVDWHMYESVSVSLGTLYFFLFLFPPPLYFNKNQSPKHMVSDWCVLKLHLLQQIGSSWVGTKKGVPSSEKRKDTFTSSSSKPCKTLFTNTPLIQKMYQIIKKQGRI
jgi:hypothetical protein